MKKQKALVEYGASRFTLQEALQASASLRMQVMVVVSVCGWGLRFEFSENARKKPHYKFITEMISEMLFAMCDKAPGKFDVWESKHKVHKGIMSLSIVPKGKKLKWSPYEHDVETTVVDVSGECPSCQGKGHFSEDGKPSLDRRHRKCGDCRGEGKK